MRALPLTLRLYLWMVYLGGVAMVVMQVQPFIASRALWHTSHETLVSVAIFALLAYIGERTTLQVSNSVSQSLATTVHISAILILPAPFPLLITLLGVVVSQFGHGHAPLYKRLFNVCHSALAVGISSAVCARLVRPTDILHPHHVIAALPALALLIFLYYVLDVGPMLGVLSLGKRRFPWQVWKESYTSTFLPEVASGTIGILGAVAWWYDHILLILFVSLGAALRVAFRAIRQAEDRALAMRQHSEQLKVVLTAGQHLRLQHTQADLLLPMAEAARALTGAASAAAYLRDTQVSALLERVALTPSDAVGVGSLYMPVPVPSDGVQEEEGLDGTGRTVLVPLELDEAGVAGLLLLSGVPTALSHDVHDALAILATQAAIALQNAHLHKRALAQASEDGLTGLFNHRSFQTRLEEEVARACRAGRPLGLMMVDLDDFGAINNTYGHQAGDATLIAVATALRLAVRSADVPARYGGDEFAVILPETGLSEARAIAERVRAAIAGLQVTESGVRITVGASVGVAGLHEHASTREELVRAADDAAYAAKRAGKGRVGLPEDAVLPLDRDPVALTAQLEHANMATVEALAAAVDAKDPYTRGHSQRVAGYAEAIAQALELSEAEVARVRLAGQLHDVGKIGVPDAILTKPGRLDEAELRLLQQHPVIGERMLAAVPFLHEILPAVRHHHERWDGVGYPDGLVGEAIPRDAAILMVADSFDAMTSSRTYRSALSVSEARQRIREGSGTQFDPRIVTAFERALSGGILKPLSSGGTAKLNPELFKRAAS